MTLNSKIFLFGLAAAAITGFAVTQAHAQTADPAAAPAAAIQVANSNKSPIVAVYTSPPGRPDWGDDMMGKGKIMPGKSMSLKLKTKPAACKVDIMAMLDNGDTRTQPNIDLCAPSPTVGF
jgi:P pilus assembly chaperone PapD